MTEKWDWDEADLADAGLGVSLDPLVGRVGQLCGRLLLKREKSERHRGLASLFEVDQLVLDCVGGERGEDLVGYLAEAEGPCF